MNVAKSVCFLITGAFGLFFKTTNERNSGGTNSMNAPYFLLPPHREGDWWGVYRSNDMIAASRFAARAERLCNELNYAAGQADGIFGRQAELSIVQAWRTGEL